MGDWATTAVALDLGGWETNPDVRAMLETGGFGLFGLFKVSLLLVMGGLGWLLSKIDDRGLLIASMAFTLSAMPAIAVSIHNIEVIQRLV